MIIVQHALWPPFEVQRRTPFAVLQGDRAARFLHAQHGDETLAEPIFADELLNELLLLELPLAILVRPTGPLRHPLGVFDQRLRMLLQEGQKVLAPYLQHVVHPRIQMFVASEREVSLENDTVKTTQNGYNDLGKRIDKSLRELHGVLRLMAA